MITYESLKSTAIALYGAWVGSGALIESDSGSPTTLSLYFDFVNSEIAANSQDFEFTKETGTITLTGATSYNLSTLFPDLISVYQVYGINSNQEQQYFPNYEANLYPFQGYTIKGNSLILTGENPSSGTLTIQYKSQYLVKNAAGTRKQYFENDDDYSVLDFADKNVLIFGIGEYITWKTDEQSAIQRDRVTGWYQKAFNNMLLRTNPSHQITSML